MRVILIGPPGVGKGTQTALMEEKLGVKALSSGAIFRHEIEEHTELGATAKRYMDQGQLVPDDVTIGMMAKHIRSEEVQRRGFVLDGFPRTVEQARALDRMLGELGSPIQKALAIVVDDEVVVERLSGRLGCAHCNAIYHKKNKPPKVEGVCDVCGHELFVRSDDCPEAIRERLKVYHGTTEPVIAFYQANGTLVEIDGAGGPAEVFSQVEAALRGL